MVIVLDCICHSGRGECLSAPRFLFCVSQTWSMYPEWLLLLAGLPYGHSMHASRASAEITRRPPLPKALGI